MVAPVSVFTTAILPIVAVGGVGYLLGSVRDVGTDGLNTVVVYVLAPALVFHSLATTTLAGATLVRITVAVVLFHIVAIVVAEAAGRAVGASRTALAALILVTAFPNTGNYGIPVSNFAFGETGRATAVVALSVQAVLIYSLGVHRRPWERRRRGRGRPARVRRAAGVCSRCGAARTVARGCPADRVDCYVDAPVGR